MTSMLRNQRNAVLALGLIMSCRMLGIFMILPVLSSSLIGKPGTTPLLVGIALGIYGLTQASLQIPFGCWSDHIGRKKVIFYGLTLFALGSLIAAWSSLSSSSFSMTGLILGRALQGAGAIGSTVMALAADLTRDEDRSKAMALIGMTIGLSFSVALIMGPMIHYWFNLSGIFFTSVLLAILAALVLWGVVPRTEPSRCKIYRIKPILQNPALIRLNGGVFSMHMIFTATFMGLPLLLREHIPLSPLGQIGLYLGVLVLAFLLMLPFMLLAEKKNKHRTVCIGAIAALAVSELIFAQLPSTIVWMALTLLFFFTAFTLLEAMLPSLVSRIAPAERKGAAMGVYSTAQFLGIFVGGSLGGLLFTQFSLNGLFFSCAALNILWLLVAIAPQSKTSFLQNTNCQK